MHSRAQQAQAREEISLSAQAVCMTRQQRYTEPPWIFKGRCERSCSCGACRRQSSCEHAACLQGTLPAEPGQGQRGAWTQAPQAEVLQVLNSPVCRPGSLCPTTSGWSACLGEQKLLSGWLAAACVHGASGVLCRYTLGGFYLARYSDSPVGPLDEACTCLACCAAHASQRTDLAPGAACGAGWTCMECTYLLCVGCQSVREQQVRAHCCDTLLACRAPKLLAAGLHEITVGSTWACPPVRRCSGARRRLEWMLQSWKREALRGRPCAAGGTPQVSSFLRQLVSCPGSSWPNPVNNGTWLIFRAEACWQLLRLNRACRGHWHKQPSQCACQPP